MPSKKIDKKDKCERCKRVKAHYLVTELVISKYHKPKPFKSCAPCARKAQRLGTKMVQPLPA